VFEVYISPDVADIRGNVDREETLSPPTVRPQHAVLQHSPHRQVIHETEH
jgi:hypothetical protein